MNSKTESVKKELLDDAIRKLEKQMKTYKETGELKLFFIRKSIAKHKLSIILNYV